MDHPNTLSFSFFQSALIYPCIFLDDYNRGYSIPKAFLALVSEYKLTLHKPQNLSYPVDSNSWGRTQINNFDCILV